MNDAEDDDYGRYGLQRRPAALYSTRKDSIDTRNPDYPPSPAWDKCDHWWETAPGDWDSAFEQMRCLRCKCPGERTKSGSVYWPTG